MPNLETRLASCLLVALVACGGGGDGPSLTPTVDTTPPVLLTMAPQGTTSWPVSSKVTLQFDEALAPATVTDSSVFLTDASGRPVAVARQHSGNWIELTPLAPLAWSTSYVVTVTPAVTDTAGNPLAARIQWSFSTEAIPGMRVRARTGAMYDLEGTQWVRCEGGTPDAGKSTRSREAFASGTWTLTKEVFSTNTSCSGAPDPAPFTVTASLTVGPDRAVGWISGPPPGLPPTVTASGIILSAPGQNATMKTLRFVDDLAVPPRLAGGKDAAGSPVDADGFPVSLVALDGVKE